MTIRLHTFDVFDTCLTRTFARPPDLFHELARRLLTASGASATPESLLQVVDYRLALERTARRRVQAQGREDLTLPEIYADFDPANPWGLDGPTMLAAEMALERASVRPVPAVRRQLEALRIAGQRLAFVSDMYLPAAVLRQMLQDHQLVAPHEALYVSGEVGRTKSRGTLFRHVCACEGVRPEEVLHHGDNLLADVAMARRQGLRARHLPAAALTPREQRLLSGTPDLCQTRSALAAASRLARLRLEGRGDPALVEVAASVAGPLLAAFGSWLLDAARRDGVERLAFVARDGQILQRVTAALAQVRPDGAPELRYLYGSRQAWFLPSLDGLSAREWDWLLVAGHSRRPVDLLRKLELTPGELVADVAPEFWNQPLDRAGEGRFRAMLDHPDNRRTILAKAAAARQLTREYLAQEGLDRPGAALVDVGWTLKTQRALNRLLFPGQPPRLSGYYLGVAASRAPAPEAGGFRAFVVEHDAYLDPAARANAFFRNANLVEQILAAADHGRVLGYRRQGERVAPVLDSAVAPQAALIQEAVVACAQEVADCGRQLDMQVLRQAAWANALDFLSNPEPRLVQALAELAVGDDQNESRRRPLARALSPLDLLRLALARGHRRLAPLAPAYGQGFDWIEGSVALSPVWLRPLLRRGRVFELLRHYRKSQ